MTRVLLVGYDPESVDFSNPALLPGMSVEKIRAGIALALKQMSDRGWQADVCYIRPDGKAGQVVEGHLASAKYDCVVIGAGVRLLLRASQTLRPLLTQSIRPLRLLPLPLTRSPMTAPMLPRDGYVRTERKALALREAKEDWNGDAQDSRAVLTQIVAGNAFLSSARLAALPFASKVGKLH